MQLLQENRPLERRLSQEALSDLWSPGTCTDQNYLHRVIASLELYSLQAFARESIDASSISARILEKNYAPEMEGRKTPGTSRPDGDGKDIKPSSEQTTTPTPATEAVEMTKPVDITKPVNEANVADGTKPTLVSKPAELIKHSQAPKAAVAPRPEVDYNDGVRDDYCDRNTIRRLMM